MRESTVVRLVLVHCLGKAGSLGEGGTVDLAAGEETQIVKDLGLVTILLLVVTDEKSPH